MPRPVLLLLLLVAPASALTLDDLFDSGSKEFRSSGNRLTTKQQAFDRLVADRGPAAVVRALRRVEPGLVTLEKQRNKVYGRFLKARTKYFNWRRKKEDDAEAVPAGINKTFLAAEREMRGVNSIVYNDLTFVEWALARLVERHPVPAGDYLAALLKDLRHKSPYQRLRCIRLIGATADPGAIKAIAAAFESESLPAVAAALAATGHANTNKALIVDRWTVQAGAIAGARRSRNRDSLALLCPRFKLLRGRLIDDCHEALTWIAGDPQADWSKWFQGLPSDWTASPPRPQAPPDPEVVHPIDSPSGRKCFGLPTGSERVVLCLDAAAAWPAVQEEVVRYLQTLPDRAEFGIVAYGAGAKRFKSKLVAASGTNRAAAAKWMAGLELAGRSDIYEGLQLAFDLVDGGAKRAAAADTMVVVALQRPSELGLSPTKCGNPRQIALEVGRRNALLRVRVLAYGLSGGGQSFYLQNLARPYGGAFKPRGR